MLLKHILIVDDSKTIRNLISFVLKKEGFKVTTAEDGLDGLEKLYSSDSIDMIISDINMPRMDGYTFMKTVREQEAYNAVPIIVLSTEGNETDIKQAMELGANKYIIKPVKPDVLMAAIRSLV